MYCKIKNKCDNINFVLNYFKCYTNNFNKKIFKKLTIIKKKIV